MPCKLKFNNCCCWNWISRSDEAIDDDSKKGADIFIVEDQSQRNDNYFDQGNPRNKVALQPGHSLMDWIRLGASGKDLTGLGSRAGTLTVSKQELAKHNKKDDVWIAIRGRVYCVTEYLSFHPGGEDTLLKGAGIDCTTLFDEVHPWVNYEQILQKCLVGKLVTIDPNIDAEALFFGEKTPSSFLKPSTPTTNNLLQVSSAKSTQNQSTQNQSIATYNETIPILPRFDWIQKMNSIAVIFYTKAFSNPLVEIHYPSEEQTVLVSMTYQETLFKNELVFHDKVVWPCDVTVTVETGKVELVFKKSIGAIWDNYGMLKQQSKSVNNSSAGHAKANYVLKRKSVVNYNTWLLQFEREDGGRIVVPVGKHVRLFGTSEDGVEISRSYTPVPDCLSDKFIPFKFREDTLCFMVKRYSNGQMSRYITDREIGDKVQISRPFGVFDVKLLENKETFLMLAGGTGVTPMLGLILFLLERRIKKCQFVRLLFFNKTEEDIPFRGPLEDLSKFDRRFKITNILSEPKDNWTGPKGRINAQMVQLSLDEHLKDTGYTIKDIFAFICGPSQFNEAAQTALEEVNISEDQMKVFEG